MSLGANPLPDPPDPTPNNDATLGESSAQGRGRKLAIRGYSGLRYVKTAMILPPWPGSHAPGDIFLLIVLGAPIRLGMILV